MNATDLMIRDWIYVDKTPIKINQVCEECIICDFGDGDEEVDCFEPITLTPEIFEKNGFIYEKGYSSIVYRLDENFLIHYENSKYKVKWTDEDCDEELSIYIKYVHELQHLIKLCKINKEIIL